MKTKLEKCNRLLKQERLDQHIKDQAIAAEWLKEDAGLREMLKDNILAYDDELKRIRRKQSRYLQSDKYQGLGDFAPYFRKRVFDEVLEGKKIKPLKRFLRNMINALKKAEGRNKVNAKWQRQYDHATRYVSIEAVVRHFLQSEHSFRNLLKCPFHEDKTPSFKVYEKDNRFYCFGCGASGSPIDFVMRFDNCDFKEAVSILSVF